MKRWAGKIVGTIVGLALTRHPIGALVGAAVGHAWDAGLFDFWLPAPGRREGAFVVPLFELAGLVAKADGRVSQAEVAQAEQLLDRLGLDPNQRRRALQAFERGRSGKADAKDAAQSLRKFSGFSGEFKAVLIDVLCGIACADGALDPKARSLIERTSNALQFDAGMLDAIIARRRGGSKAQSVDDPYAVLGVSRDVDEQTLRAAYRRLMSMHHPDRLGAVDDELRAAAQARAAAVNAAFEQIKAHRGMV